MKTFVCLLLLGLFLDGVVSTAYKKKAKTVKQTYVHTKAGSEVYQCPADAVETPEGKCAVKAIVDAVAYCPTGTLVEGQCAVPPQYVEPVPVCPADFTMVASRKSVECVAETTTAANMKCPNGYVESAAGCEKTIRITPKFSCETGFAFRNGVCVKVAAAAADLVCPSGFTLAQGGTTSGVKRVCAKRHCKKRGGCKCTKYWRSKHRGAVCTAETVTPAEFVCKAPHKGMLASSVETCSQTNVVKQEAILTCGEGVLRGTDCVVITEVEPVAICPDGTPGPTCTSIAEVPAKLSCPHGSSMTMTPEGVVECVVAVKAVEGCKSSKCYTTTASPATASCSKGGALKGTVCVIPNQVKASMQCPDGITPGKKGCPPLVNVVAAAALTCPAGFPEPNAEGLCEKSVTSTFPAAVKCQPGFFVRAELAEVCVKVMEERPILECPAGFTGPNRKGICTQEITAAAVVQCPKELPFDGTNCVSSQTVAMVPVCPKRSEFKNGVCVEVRYAKASMECIEGVPAKGGQCILEQPPTQAALVCPGGITPPPTEGCLVTQHVPKIAVQVAPAEPATVPHKEPATVPHKEVPPKKTKKTYAPKTTKKTSASYVAH